MDETQQGVEVGAVILPVEAAVNDFYSTMKKLEQDIAQMPCIPVKVCPDVDHFKRSIDRLRQIEIDCIPVKLCVDGESFRRDLDFLSATQHIKVNASIDLDSVKAQLDAIANQPRTIYYSAVVQMPDVQALQSSIQSEIKTTVDPKELRNAAPDIGKAIAKEVGNSKVQIDQGGFLSRIVFRGISSVFQGFQESIGREIFKGVSNTRKQSFQGIGSVVDRVTSAAGEVVRDTALKGAGFADVKDFRQAFKNFKLEDLFLEPIQKASSLARESAVRAKVEGENSAKAYFSVFRTTLISELKSSKDIKAAGLSAFGRTVGAAAAVTSPVQDFRRDVAIGKAKKEAESIEVEFTPQEIESIMRAEKQILVGNTGFYLSGQGNLGDGIIGAPSRRFLGQEFVGVDNKQSVDFLRGNALPDPLKKVINEEKTLAFFRNLAKVANKLGLDVPEILGTIDDGSQLEEALLNGLKDRSGSLKRFYLSAIENTFGSGVNADLAQQIARVNAIKKMRPDLEVKGVGFSGGGYVVDQLSRATGIKTVALGTPFFRPPAAVSARGQLDSIYSSYGNSIIQNIQDPNIEDLRGVGKAHLPQKYFGKKSFREFANQKLDLGLSASQIESQGVDFRSIGSFDKNIEAVTKALASISIASGHLEDVSGYVQTVDFSDLSVEEVAETLETFFESIEGSIEGFDEAIGDPIVDDYRDKLTGIVDKYQSAIAAMIDQPEKIAEAFQKYTDEFQATATEAAYVRASDIVTPEIPQPPKIAQQEISFDSAAQESQVLAEQIKVVTAEVVQTKNPLQVLGDNIKKAETITLDLLTQGRGAQTKQALQLTGGYQLKELGRTAITGTANVLRGGYGALQGAENAALGLTPFGVGFGAKKVLQAGAGFAALNAVAPAAGQLVLTAGSGLGATFTQYMMSHTPGFVTPIVQALGSGMSSLLGGLGGNIGTGAALLGAGATTVAATEKIVGGGLNAIAPQPLQFAFKEAKQAELVGIEISQKITQSVLKGAAQNAQAYIAPAQKVEAEISPITKAFQSPQYTELPQVREQFSLVTPRPNIGTKPTGLSADGAVLQAKNLVIASQEAKGKFLSLLTDPAIKNGRIDLLYNASVEAQRLVQKAQAAKDELRQLSYENRGTSAQQKITGRMGPIVENAKEAQNLLRELIKGYEKSGRDIGVFIQAGIASGLSPEDSAAAAEKLVAVIQRTIETGFEIASPSKWARRAGQFIVQGLGIGLGAKDAIASANRLADGVIAATEKGFGSRFKGIGNQFVLGLQDEIVQAQNKLTNGRQVLVKPFDGADDAIKFGANTTIAEIRESANRIGVEIEKTSSLYESTKNGFRKKLFTPFNGDDNAVAFNPNTKIKQIIEQAKAQGIEYERTVQKFELVGRGSGQTPVVQSKWFTQFQGNDNRIPFNPESRVGYVVHKAQSKGLYAQGIEQPKYELKDTGIQKKTFTETGYKYDPIDQDLAQNLSKVRKTKEQIQKEAFATGQQYGESVGSGLKSAGRFVETEAKRIGDRIPEGLKSGTGAGIQGIKGFVSGLREQFATARKDIPTLDLLASGIKNVALLAGGGFVGFQAFQILTAQANQSYDAIKRLQSQKVVVNFATGSTAPLDAAEKQAKALGTNLVTARDSIKSLAIQAKNTPLEQKVVPIFEGASTAASALQLNPEQQGRLFTAFNQIAGKGTVQSEELRGQLGELGISFQLAARAAGMTTSEFNKQLAAGAVLSQDFLPKFANQLKLELGGAALAAGDSVQGLENKVANATTKLQEGLGKESLPLVSTGLKTFAGTLDFAANNVSTLTNLINVALIGALLKGGQAFKTFAFAQQTVTSFDAAGNIASATRSSRAGRAFQGARDFVSGGGVQRFAKSEVAKDLANIGTQVVAVSAGIGAFQAIAEGFTGGERYQEFNRVLETTEKRIQAINAAERDRLALKNDQPGRTGDEVRKDQLQTTASAISDLTSLNFKGFFQKTARNFQQSLGGDPTTALSDGPLATQEQADNRRILNSASDVLESKKFQDERNKAFALATRLRNNQAVDPQQLKDSREVIQSRLDSLKAVPEDLRKLRPEIDAEIKQLEALQKSLSGTGSAYSKLAKAAQEFEDIISKQNALEKAVSGADAARGRAKGLTNEFDSKIAELKAQSAEATKNRAALGNLIKASEAFIGSQEFASLKTADPGKAETERKRLIDLKTQFAGADKQIDDLITQNRLDAVNRRSELLQREVREQERAIAKLESIRRVRTTDRDADLSEGIANQTVTPQALRVQQSQNTFADAKDTILEQAKKRENALKNLRKARADLSQINPNDEQQFEQGKAAVAQYEQAVLSAEAEINNQRKTAAEATTQYRTEIEEQIRTQIDLTTRKAEQGITAQQQATERLGNAQKRQIENSVAGLQRQQKFLELAASAIDRAAKLSSKRSELNTALNQGAQIPLNGTIAVIRDAEGLIQKLKQKDLDPAVRGRTSRVLSQLGISNNEQDAFKYRVREEEKLARLKADGISAEIQQSQLTLDFEQRREEFAAKRAVLAAQETVEAAKRSAIETEIERKKAENEVRRSQIGVIKATAQLDLAKQSGDPNKVREAELNLQDAQLTAAGAQDTLTGARQTEKLAKDALPNATLSVVDALANFAATIEGGKLSRRILGIQNQNKVAQFGVEEQGRRRGLAIEGIDKGVSLDINAGDAVGPDTFGFRAERARDEANRNRDRQRFQNSLRGIPNEPMSNGAFIAPPTPVDTSKLLGSDAMNAMDASMKAIAGAINFDPVTTKLSQLIEIEARLSAQILSLAGREQVQVVNQSYYGQDNNVLAGTTL
jgi:tape measure domain-containing protein